MKNMKAAAVLIAASAFVYGALFAIPVKNGTIKKPAEQEITMTQPAGGEISSGGTSAASAASATFTSGTNTGNVFTIDAGANTGAAKTAAGGKAVPAGQHSATASSVPTTHNVSAAAQTKTAAPSSAPVTDPDAAFYWTTPAPHVVTIDPENGVFENQTPLSFFARYPKVHSDGTPIVIQGCFWGTSNYTTLFLVTKTPCGGDSVNPKKLQYIFPKRDSDNRIIFTNGSTPMADRDDAKFRDGEPLGAVLYNTPQGKAWVLAPGVYQIQLACSTQADNTGGSFEGFRNCYGMPVLEFEVKYQKKGGTSK